MNKYKKAYDDLLAHMLPENDNERLSNSELYDSLMTIKYLIEKETPMEPNMVMLLGDEVPTCPRENCGVGLNPIESIWHKSTYCGKCGQKIDWSYLNE